MFSPVGNHPPSVYWRRRLFVLGSAIVLVLLIVLTVNVISGGGDTPVAASESSSSSAATTTSAPPATTTAPSSTQQSSSAASSSATSQAPSSTAPAQCAASALAIEAVAGQSTYKVGAQPVLAVQVTNVGARPCVQDLSDKQIVLKVYNGESRVWGSHDCEIQPGTTERTLPVRQPVRVTITWSGRTSQAGCKGTRQQVGVGTYTLYATLAGKSGKADRFSFS